MHGDQQDRDGFQLASQVAQLQQHDDRSLSSCSAQGSQHLLEDISLPQGWRAGLGRASGAVEIAAYVDGASLARTSPHRPNGGVALRS